MKKNFLKKSLIFLLTLGIFLGVRFVFAQDFGTAEVEAGLGGTLSTSDPREIIGRIINIVLGFLGVIALGLITYAGYIWMTSNGNEEQITKAKKTLTSAAIGLVIILSAWAITTFVLSRLSDASHGGGSGVECTSGATLSCGYGGNGTMYCINGSWGNCIGGSDYGPGQNNPKYCDVDTINPGCQANSNLCAPSDYCDDNCLCVPRGGTGDSCNLNDNGNICSASDDLCGEFLSCDPISCTCAGPPVITNISPAGGFCQDDFNISCENDSQCSSFCNKTTANGAVGNLITISGSGFGEYDQFSSKVVFTPGVSGRSPQELNLACVNTWNDNQIIISVPLGAKKGAIEVIRADGLSDLSDNDYGPRLEDFIVNNIPRPGLCAVNPKIGLLGDDFTYQGISLQGGKAYFGNYSNNVEALNSNFSHVSGYSGTARLANIRDGQADSFIRSKVGDNFEVSNYLRITKDANENDGPYVVSFSPQTGAPGQYVTILGSGFGSNQSSSHVYFGDKEAQYDFPLICASSIWTNNEIIVKVPEGLDNGEYFIKLKIGDDIEINTSNLNPNTFKIDNDLSLKPSLCKREPNSGTIGTSVKLYGEYFGDENRQGTASFHNNRTANGDIKKENRADVMTVSVPEGAISGPLKVIKNSQFGNELSFSVSSCKTNDDCLGKVCCPANTYKSGRCVANSQDCLINIPTSVFEWDFSTAYKISEISDPSESCNTLAKYYGACQTGVSCPNAAGVCSPYSGGDKKVVSECDYSCASVLGCQSDFGSACTYDPNINKCVKNNSSCSLPRSQKFQIAGVDYDFNLSCNSNKNWEIKTNTSCPEGWDRALNNVCIDSSSDCDICDSNLSCLRMPNGEGSCVSDMICPNGSECVASGEPDVADTCLKEREANCDCCCRIGNSAQDCCVPLECDGTCGNDTSDNKAGLGVCSGCAAAGNTQAQRDDACNCEITSGQFCAISTDMPQGYCTDCSSLKDKESCDLHSSVCCFDSISDTCRGGSGTEISDNADNPEYGYCAYYSCDSDDKSICADKEPSKFGFYKNIDTCKSSCASNEGDACNIFNNLKDKCDQASACCFDYDSNVCKSGNEIASGVNAGYCSYYDCLEDENKCNEEEKLRGQYNKLDRCLTSCSNIGGGAGRDCASSFNVSSCDFNICDYYGMSCKAYSGENASGISDCGVCCCDPNASTDTCSTKENPDLFCQKNVGNCSGDKRGLCCGCSADSDCGNGINVGCGNDACCQARPEVKKDKDGKPETKPESGDLDVCRNAVMRVVFNQEMDTTSFSNGNVLLLQQMDYKDGVCPEGSLAYNNEGFKKKGVLARLFGKINSSIKIIVARIFKNNDIVLADAYDENKLYCVHDVTVMSEVMNKETVLNVLPRKLLAPDSNYFLIIKGDEDLNSQTGVLSYLGIGLNGEGLLRADGFNEGEALKFNAAYYKNSHIVQFKTLSDKKSNSGVCAIDSVGVNPSSYLFSTTENSIDENDKDSRDRSFDTKRDSDKVFSAWAYSDDKQIIQPVTGYFWKWNFSLSDNDVATFNGASDIEGLESNRVLVKVKAGVTDAETRLVATVDMDSFLGENAESSPACACLDDNCSSNCLNSFSVGADLSGSSNIYIFICNNPWPPISQNGYWSPWLDNCYSPVGDKGSCIDFNYKFYYCRDAGEPGTFDDLPAISNEAVIRGQSNVLSCSSDGSSCTGSGDLCGEDRNGDGNPDGVCVKSVLKESYFFRERVLNPGEIISLIDTKKGGELEIRFKSSVSDLSSYKIYYGELGKAINKFRQISVADASCETDGLEYVCSSLIGNLENNKNYQFRISLISTKGSESALSNAVIAKPSDKTAPQAVTNFKLDNLEEESLKFSWDAGRSDVASYRFYRGIRPGFYAESYDTGNTVNSFIFPKSKLVPGKNYFSLSALDFYGNESEKALELEFNIE